jgi:Mg2+ and Co2+ transporter CorA
MANMKRIEKRLNEVEDWVKAFEKGSGPTQTMDNMNWLVHQLRSGTNQLAEQQQQMMQMQQALQNNMDVVSKFMEEKELVRDWQAFVARIQKEAEDAVQEQETESVDAQEQAGDGEEMGEGDA